MLYKGRFSHCNVGHLMFLIFFAPDFVDPILAESQPVDLTAEGLIKCTDLPLN